MVLKSQGKFNFKNNSTPIIPPSEEISQNAVALKLMTDPEIEEAWEKLEVEDSTDLPDNLSIEDDLESLELSELHEESLEIIESLDSLEMTDLNSTLSYTIILEDCGEDPCSFIFADSTLTDQAIGNFSVLSWELWSDLWSESRHPKLPKCSNDLWSDLGSDLWSDLSFN